MPLLKRPWLEKETRCLKQVNGVRKKKQNCFCQSNAVSQTLIGRKHQENKAEQVCTLQLKASVREMENRTRERTRRKEHSNVQGQKRENRGHSAKNMHPSFPLRQKMKLKHLMAATERDVTALAPSSTNMSYKQGLLLTLLPINEQQKAVICGHFCCCCSWITVINHHH